jgi:rhodanese-related sulfurtransferase
MNRSLIGVLAMLTAGVASVPDTARAQQTQAQAAGFVLKPIITVGEAHARAQAGEIVLVDIRTPEEWKETGVATSAHAITMHQDPRRFTQQVLAALGGDRTRPVALICRTGNRSSNLLAEMRRAGFTNVADVGEGMAGSRHGKGWLKSGLPVRTGGQATAQPAIQHKATPK